MKNLIWVLLFVYAVLAACTIIYFDGTGDSGDSVTHFLFAKYAPVHPELYFHHWAKPVFVLLASPFAQFGFNGMKVFNALVSLFTIYYTWKIAAALNFKNTAVAALIMIFVPLYFALTFSGLTEPLFALFLALGIYLLIKEKYLAACILISFLPFVRSEGLIIIGVIGIFLLLKRQWKMLPVLFTGHLVYSIAGYFVHHDLLWVFRKIPYATLNSVYGHGELMHFVDQLFYVLGIPVYILFLLGIISIVWRSVKKKSSRAEQVLIFLGFFAFFIAHTLFWYLGIFGSLGLVRVLIGVMPLIAIIALQGFNFLTEELMQKQKNARIIFQSLIVIGIIVFPFTKNKAALHPSKTLSLTKEQISVIKVADTLVKAEGKNHRFIYAHPYLSIALDIDPFDSQKSMELNKGIFVQLQKGDILVWENWFTLKEKAITKEELDANPELVNIYDYKTDDDGRELNFAAYKKK